ncbi:MAG: alkaline phosphatase family protein [Vicinamibacteria bacterium]
MKGRTLLERHCSSGVSIGECAGESYPPPGRQPIVKVRPIAVVLAGLCLGSVLFAAQLWTWVLNFDPAFEFRHPPAVTGEPLTPSVTLLLIDGLRLDASRRMPTLNALRAQGADIEAQVGTPSFSRPGRATIAVGAPPAIHGVTSNRQKRAIPLDNILRRVADIKGSCRVAGSLIWSSLFSADIARCGVYRTEDGKEGPGTFVADIGAIRAGHADGLDFVLREPATLRIADIVATDFAAHEYGGASPEYANEISLTDATLAGLVRRLDLSRETLIVTADHGHRDLGGHGGDEPEVLTIPIVMVGAGIRPGVSLKAQQADIAPTVAALLGTSLPAATSGHPLAAALLMDDTKAAAVKAADAAQSAGLDQALIARLGARRAAIAERGWQALTETYRMDVLLRRVPLAGGIVLAIFLGSVTAILMARPMPGPFVCGFLTSLVLFAGPTRWALPVLSFSAINYDQMLIPFFVRVMSVATLTALLSMIVGLFVWRRMDGVSGAGSAASVAGSIGLGCTAVLALWTSATWLHDGLLVPYALPGPNQLVLGYCLTLSVMSVSAATLLVLGVLSLSSRRTSATSI